MRRNTVHPICKQIRELRQAAGLSLNDAEAVVGVPGIVLGSYERGDRQPSVGKAERILSGFGYTMVAVPNTLDAVRLPADMAQELRAIANQLDREKKRRDVSDLPDPAAPLQ